MIITIRIPDNSFTLILDILANCLEANWWIDDQTPDSVIIGVDCEDEKEVLRMKILEALAYV